MIHPKDSQWTESTQERVLLTLGCDLPSSSASGKHSKGLAPLEKRTTVKHIKDLYAWGFIRVNMSKMSKRYIWMISKKNKQLSVIHFFTFYARYVFFFHLTFLSLYVSPSFYIKIWNIIKSFLKVFSPDGSLRWASMFWSRSSMAAFPQSRVVGPFCGSPASPPALRVWGP